MTQYSKAALDTRIKIANCLLSDRERNGKHTIEDELALVAQFLADTVDVSEYDQQVIEAELDWTVSLIGINETRLLEIQITLDQLRAKMQLLRRLLSKKQYGCEPPSHTEFQNRRPQTPMDMLLSQYKGMKLADIVAQVLNNSLVPLTPKDIARLIYTTFTPEDFDRAHKSLAAEMRSGAKGENPRWKKIGRSAYVALSAPVTAVR